MTGNAGVADDLVQERRLVGTVGVVAIQTVAVQHGCMGSRRSDLVHVVAVAAHLLDRLGLKGEGIRSGLRGPMTGITFAVDHGSMRGFRQKFFVIRSMGSVAEYSTTILLSIMLNIMLNILLMFLMQKSDSKTRRNWFSCLNKLSKI